MEKNEFYVYEHIRKDNNTCFYVGKGHGNRIQKNKRNEFHDRIANKYGMYTKIVKDNLTEEEAYALEKETIKNYVFNLGYGICIDGYRNFDGNFLTNMNWGGIGVISGIPHTEEWKKQHSIDMIGSKNPMFGVNVYDTYDENKTKEIKKKLSKAFSGENNPMFGISPKERMDEETYEKWHAKVMERCASQIGSKNPNSKMVELYDCDRNYICTFDCIGDCAQYIISKTNSTASINSVRSSIRYANKNNVLYKGYYFKYI